MDLPYLIIGAGQAHGYLSLFSILAENLSIEEATLSFADLSFTRLFLPENTT